MAKMKRVYEIAKELGVASKAIVDKCNAEGVPGVDTHMSPVKIGLEMTIREWFTQHTAQDPSTAVEETKPVDLDKARRARRKRAKAPGAAADDASHDGHDGHDTSVAVEEPPVRIKDEPPAHTVEEVARQIAQPAKSKPKKPDEHLDTAAAAHERHERESALAPAALAPHPSSHAAPSPARIVEAPAQPAVAALAPKPQPAGRPNVPNRPNVVSPVGPKLEKPGEVTLRGPKVIRVEQPDVIAAPRRRTGGPGGGGGGGGGGGLLGFAAPSDDR